MKKLFIGGLFLIGLLFLTACEIDPSKIDTDEIIKCEAPYIRVGVDCCLDQNDNKICDKDEEEPEPTVTTTIPEEEGCEDECSSEFCTGLDYTECLMKSDGCKDKNFRGKVPGKCGVECTTDNNCDSNEECENYKCLIKEEPIVTTTTTLEEEELPGAIAISIDKIYTAVTGDDLGEISKVVFTIDNGKDKVLKPIVNVYAWDEENKDPYETRSRGEYTYISGINPGDKHTGSIDLVPKTWVNLDLEKNIRLTLNDTEDGFITAVNQQIFIS